MSIWGKIIGGVAGFAIAGPLGALLGAVAGHAVDKVRGGAATADHDARQVTFTIAVIVLSAKMAKADGRVTRAEIDAFKDLFRVPPQEMKNIGRLFDEARQDAAGFEPYAEQVAHMFAHEPAVLEELLGGLFHIAKADGVIQPPEIQFLRQVAAIFGFDGRRFDRIRARHARGDDADPYQILGLSHDASDAEVKKVYRQLIRENHPDALIAQGVPQEFIDVANEKMAAITTAYERVRKHRDLA